MTVTEAGAATAGTDQARLAACCEPPTLAGPVAPPDDEQLAMLAKAIAHPARLTILRLLSKRSTCTTGDVVEQLPLAQSTVSEHLRILREAGLITGEIEGPRTRYCIDPTGLALLHAGVATL
jgi:ArsR family transcriptional regulator, arsenate/arsenite/antimonite-responsive transcriptional repressor